MRDSAPAKAEIDPKAVREKAGLAAAEMAALIGMSEYGYTAWEAGHRRPGGPAHRLLALIDADPDTTTRRLASL